MPGRSRQDISTRRIGAAKLRNQTLDFAEALLGLRAKLLAKRRPTISTH